ncbi:MAG TPA: hypothetical protein VI937_01660, partial [Negativicutes bacterium]|nr:hypothetical protein [Negativicutes bacterium]
DFAAREDRVVQQETRGEMLQRLCRTTRVTARRRKCQPVFIQTTAQEEEPTHKPVFNSHTESMGIRHKRWHFTRYARG